MRHYISCPRDECDGEIGFTTSENSDGDAGVIGGIRSWIEADYADQTCACKLTDAELDALGRDVAERAADGEFDNWAEYNSADHGMPSSVPW